MRILLLLKCTMHLVLPTCFGLYNNSSSHLVSGIDSSLRRSSTIGCERPEVFGQQLPLPVRNRVLVGSLISKSFFLLYTSKVLGGGCSILTLRPGPLQFGFDLVFFWLHHIQNLIHRSNDPFRTLVACQPIIFLAQTINISRLQETKHMAG